MESHSQYNLRENSHNQIYGAQRWKAELRHLLGSCGRHRVSHPAGGRHPSQHAANKWLSRWPRQDDDVFVDVDGVQLLQQTQKESLRDKKELWIKKKKKMKTQILQRKEKPCASTLESTRRSPSETLRGATLACLSEAHIQFNSLQCLLGRRPKRNRKAHIKKVSLP